MQGPNFLHLKCGEIPTIKKPSTENNFTLFMWGSGQDHIK